MKFLRRFCTLSIFLLTAASCSPIFGRSVKYINYPVQKGDTLYTLSQRFDVSMSEIEDMNDLDDVSRLEIGEILRIPYVGQNIARNERDSRARVRTAAIKPKPDPK